MNVEFVVPYRIAELRASGDGMSTLAPLPVSVGLLCRKADGTGCQGGHSGSPRSLTRAAGS